MRDPLVNKSRCPETPPTEKPPLITVVLRDSFLKGSVLLKRRAWRCVCLKRVRLHGLDLSTKHVADDSREPEMKKAAKRQPTVDSIPGYLSTPGAWFPCFPQTKEIAKLVIPQTIRE